MDQEKVILSDEKLESAAGGNAEPESSPDPLPEYVLCPKCGKRIPRRLYLIHKRECRGPRPVGPARPERM